MKKQSTKKLQLGKLTIAGLSKGMVHAGKDVFGPNTLYHSICPCTGGCPR
ncbi:hypothetical protein KTO58_17815 [Chitinophaga pendula]|nr:MULTISPECIES: hypothetical protein [Chitinophaga]UCJ05544.1 hypothetical protein KTO58_17815 [Chitinophaga pendula]